MTDSGKYWIREIREMAGLSIEELAELTGYVVATIKYYDSGTQSASRGHLPAMLIQCLGVDPVWMRAMLLHELTLIEDWRRRACADFHTPMPQPSKIEGNPFLKGHPVLRKCSHPAPGTKLHRGLIGNAEPSSHAPETDCPLARLPLPSRFKHGCRGFLAAWKAK